MAYTHCCCIICKARSQFAQPLSEAAQQQQRYHGYHVPLVLCVQPSTQKYIKLRFYLLQISTLHAEVLALRAEREDLELRVQKGASSLTRLELELKDRTADMSSSIKAKADEAAHATAAYHRERKEKVGAACLLGWNCLSTQASKQGLLRQKTYQGILLTCCV